MIIPPIRGRDDWGDGAYLAPRGHREHQGVDFACYPGSSLISPVRGVVLRIGSPYPPDDKKGFYKLIEIRVDAQTTVKIMYIDPAVEPGQYIEEGDFLGAVQNLTVSYPELKQDGVTIKRAITNHYHFEVWVEGVHVDPIAWLNYIQEID